MNTATVSAAALAMIPTGNTAPQADTAGAASFADVLMGMQGQTGLNMTDGAGNLSWREMQSFGQNLGLNMGAFQLLGNTDEDESLSGILTKMMDMLNGKAYCLDAEANNSEMLALLEKLQKELQKMQGSDGQIVAGQQLLVLLAQMTGRELTPALTTDGTLTLEMAGSEEALQTLMESTPEDVLRMLNGEGATSFLETLTQPAAQNTQQAQRPMAQQANPEAAEELALNGSATETETLTGQAGEAKNALSALNAQEENGVKLSDENGKTLDTETLQQTSLQPAMRNTVVTTGKAELAATPAPIALQMQEGIQTGIQKGLDEFSIKLMPEGLGEVTVKLKNTEEGFKLTLVAKNADTQRLLAADIAQLRENLRGMKVEVQEVLTSRQEEMLNFQQNFQNRHSQAWREMHGAAYYRDEALGGESSEELRPIALRPESALDAYI